MNNSSLANDTRSNFQSNADLWALWRSQTGLYSAFIVVGLPVNLWFLLAIVTSRKLRVHLRNKLLSGLLLSHLLDTAVVLPLFLAVERVYRYRAQTAHNCLVRSFFWNLSTVQNIIANWTLVHIALLFLAHVNSWNLSLSWSRTTRRCLTNVIPALPWIAGLLFSLVIPGLTVFHEDPSVLCIYIEKSKTLISKSLESAVPLVCAFVIVAVAAVQRWRWRNKAASGRTVMATELIGRDSGRETVLPYAAMVCVALSLDIPNMCRYMALPFESFTSRVNFAFTSHVLVAAQSVVMPFVLLLLDDFRYRIKTWRPWHCSNVSEELNVGYCSTDSGEFAVEYSQANP